MTLAYASRADVLVIVVLLVIVAAATLVGFLSTHDDEHLARLEEEVRRRPVDRPALRTYSVFDWRIRGDVELREEGARRTELPPRVDQQPTR